MADISIVPPPWKLKATSWAFILPEISKGFTLPPGFASSFEAESMLAGGQFIGGKGMILLMSYSESPVGPYDELVYMPGQWKYADGRTGSRITRIYVSSKASVKNGRHNWNTPKQLADFDFSTGLKGTTTVSVSLPGEATPFFKASIKSMPLISSIRIPINSKYIPKSVLEVTYMQPPLPTSDAPEEVGTTQWAVFSCSTAGKAKLVKLVSGFEDGHVGDGKEFPAVTPWSTGFALDDVEMDVGVPVFYDTV